MDVRVKEVLEGEDRSSLAPEILELSLISSCDSSCLACWCHSPLIREEKERKEGEYLTLEEIESVVRGLSKKGLKEVQVSGSGEPLLHPHIRDILKLLKEEGLRVHLVTNFLSADEEDLSSFVDTPLDTITVSLWAGTPETFVLLHPNREEKDFMDITDKIKRLRRMREEKNQINPRIRIYHVLNHLNSQEMGDMFKHALQAGADMIEFKCVDVIPGKTDFLSLTSEDISSIRRSIKEIRENMDFPYSSGYNPLEVPHLRVFPDISLRKELMDSGRYLLTSFLPPGFRISFEKMDPDNPEPHQLNIRCPKNRVNHRSILKEEPHQTFSFFYFREYCKECSRLKHCFGKSEVKEVKLPYLSILALGRLERELESYQRYGTYAQEIVDKIPCYAGWLYARIEADGEVIPCCKGHNFPVGNIREKGFWEIWNGATERIFRREGRRLKKDSPLFSLIGCRKGCDNIGMNISFHGKIISG